MTDKLPLLEPDCIYHIYSHAVRNSNLFNDSIDYQRFINKYKMFINPIAKTYVYCLMPNHIHLVVRIRAETELKTYYKSKFRKLVMDKGLDEDISLEELTQLNSKQFSNLFSSFTQSMNRTKQQKGSLFERPFKRKKVLDRAYFKRLIIYVHRNPIHHGFCTTFEDWYYSSWWSLVFDAEDTWLERLTVFNVFQSKQGFISEHKEHLEDFNDMLTFDEN